jgi:hypothetical protein
MRQMATTNHHVVVVRNPDGRIVHTHEVVEFEDVSPLNEQQLLDAALAAAKRALRGAHSELTPSMSSREELQRIRLETLERFGPR